MKKFFDTPRKAVISAVCIVAFVLAAVALMGAIVLKQSLISKSEAGAAALADAGLKEADVSALRVNLDFDDGRFEYEVDFYCNGAEYEYVIQAKDGDIIARDIEGGNREVGQNGRTNPVNPAPSSAAEPSGSEQSAAEPFRSGQSAAEPSRSEQSAVEPSESEQSAAELSNDPATQEISLEMAKEAALADAGLSDTEVTFTKERLDNNDGIKVYDLEFYTADAEYDYEINAFDGTVHEKDMEAFGAGQQAHSRVGGNRPEGSDIGVDRAKEIALDHAGLTEAEVRFVKAEFEYDDGRAEYEVEFYLDRTEYSYSVDAASGDIIHYEADSD